MKGREDQVARVRRLERRVQRFEISNFADEDDVRVLPQHAAQRLAERRRIGADLALVDVRVDVAMEELDRILDRDHVGATTLVDVLDHRRERRRLAGACHPGHENETARLQRDLLEHRWKIELADRARLIWNGAHGVAQRPALLIDVDAEPTDARHADREVALLLFGELLDLARRHELFGQRLEILRAQRLVLERLQLTVDADRRRTSDLQMQVGSVASDQLLEHGLEANAARRGWTQWGGFAGALRWISHWDRS